MVYREWLIGEMHAGRISFRQFRTRVRRACRALYLIQEPIYRAQRERQERERKEQMARMSPPIERVLSR